MYLHSGLTQNNPYPRTVFQQRLNINPIKMQPDLLFIYENGSIICASHVSQRHLCLQIKYHYSSFTITNSIKLHFDFVYKTNAESQAPA